MRKTNTKVSKIALLRRSVVMSPKRCRERSRLVAFILIGSVAISALIIGGVGQYTANAMKIDTAGQILPIKAIPAKVLSVREYVKQEILSAGLDWDKIQCTLDHESDFRVMAYYVNSDKSVDRGIWMWNDKWNKRISNECAFDKVCSTKEAIAKIKHDGNLSAWYGSLKCN